MKSYLWKPPNQKCFYFLPLWIWDQLVKTFESYHLRSFLWRKDRYLTNKRIISKAVDPNLDMLFVFPSDGSCFYQLSINRWAVDKKSSSDILTHLFVMEARVHLSWASVFLAECRQWCQKLLFELFLYALYLPELSFKIILKYPDLCLFNISLLKNTCMEIEWELR